MSLESGNKLEVSVENILVELQSHHRDRTKLLGDFIQERLVQATQSYYKDLTQSFDYLKYRNEDNLIKKYERYI